MEIYHIQGIITHEQFDSLLLKTFYGSTWHGMYSLDLLEVMYPEKYIPYDEVQLFPNKTPEDCMYLLIKEGHSEEVLKHLI